MQTKTLILLAVVALGAAFSRAEDEPAPADNKPTPEQARKTYEAADARLTIAYKEAGAGLEPGKMKELRQSERDWIVYRDSMIGADFGSESATKHTADYWEAMAEYAKERTGFLRAYSGKNTPAGISGKYSDSQGGTLELKETKEGAEFSLSVVRGRAHNEGEMDGTLHVRDGKAYFKETQEANEQGPPCELAFTFIGGHIVRVGEKVASQSVGFNVHFDGDYYKIGNLKEPDAAPVAAATPAPTPAITPVATPPAAATTTPAGKPTVDQARKTFEATDALLTAAYKEAGAGLDPRKMLELRQSERNWIQYRETLAKSAPYFNNAAQSDSPKGTVDYWQTMDDTTRARIDFLRAWTGKKAPPGITGEYSDSYGGTLELEERKSGLAFSISTVRGMARNQGNIDGVAQRTGDKACYKDHPDAGDDRAPCEITLTFIEGHIVKVEEKNGDYYHGFNANFDGLYYKTGKLEKPLKPD